MCLCERYRNRYCFGQQKTRHDQFVEQDIEQQEEVAAQSTLPEEAQMIHDRRLMSVDP